MTPVSDPKPRKLSKLPIILYLVGIKKRMRFLRLKKSNQASGSPPLSDTSGSIGQCTDSGDSQQILIYTPKVPPKPKPRKRKASVVAYEIEQDALEVKAEERPTLRQRLLVYLCSALGGSLLACLLFPENRLAKALATVSFYALVIVYMI